MLLSIGRMKGIRGVVSFAVALGLAGVEVSACIVPVMVIDSVVVHVDVSVTVMCMNEVSKIDLVTSTVSVWYTVTSSVTKTVTPALVVTVTASPPRGARVMVGIIESAMVDCVALDTRQRSA